MMSVPSRRRFLLASTGAGALLALGAWKAWRGSGRTRPTVVRRSSHALGTSVSLTVVGECEEQCQSAIDAAFAEIELVESVMSIYRPNSQLRKLNATGVVEHPHAYLAEVMRRAQTVSKASGGAFDVTVQPLWELYAAARQRNELPAEDAIAAARKRVDWRRLRVTDEVIRFTAPGMAVTLNGIAQGFATDRALAALQSHGIEHALVDAGEVASIGHDAENQDWTVGVQHPREPEAYAALARLDNRALSTSGDYATTFSEDRRQNHIFDPRTGASPESFASVSIVAPTAMLADALSTACFVLKPSEAMELMAAMPDADAFCVLKNGRTLTTPGFPKLA
jgi:thiamine biosynthesis lipoprotein